MQDNMARLALRRNNARPAAASVCDFEQGKRAPGALRSSIAALVVTTLGLLGAGGIALAAAATSTEQANNSLVVDEKSADESNASPENDQLDVDQQAAAKQAQNKKTSEDGGLGGVFGQRGTSANRNGVRAELNRTLASTKVSQRAKSLAESNQSVVDAKAAAEAAQREKQMAEDVAKVKAEAKRIEEEKRKAAELLKKLQEEAAKNKAAGKTGPEDVTAAPGHKMTAEDLQNFAKGGAAFPLKPGTYSTGAYFGKTGSWARYHTGQDFPAPTGTPVYAAASGIVGSNMSAAGWAGSKYVTIHHSGGGSTLYAHLSGRVVSAGQPVKAGQLIGYVGNEGRSFGAHLHFEYYPPGTIPGDVYSASDPMSWLRSRGAGR